MKITLSENLRKMRRDRDLTQEDLANFLGISFQAVSKWERDEGYPDISLLPVIANFFGVTVDALIGNDVITQEDKIQKYCMEYEQYNTNGEMDSAAVAAANAYRDYPYDWRIIDIYCRSLTRGYSQHPGEKLPELRMLCQMVKDKCPDAKIRMHAVYSMLFAENDDLVEEWFEEVPGTYDFSEGERREDRYLERNQMDKYRYYKQRNMMQLYRYLFEKLGANPSTVQEKINALQVRASLQDALFGGENAICEKYRYAFNQLLLSAAFFECGQKQEGYSALEKSIKGFVEWFLLPQNEELHFSGLFDTLEPVKRTKGVDSVVPFLVGDRQLKGFKNVSYEDKFISLTQELQQTGSL